MKKIKTVLTKTRPLHVLARGRGTASLLGRARRKQPRPRASLAGRVILEGGRRATLRAGSDPKDSENKGASLPRERQNERNIDNFIEPNNINETVEKITVTCTYLQPLTRNRILPK